MSGAGRLWFASVLAIPKAVLERLNPVIEPLVRAGWAPRALGVSLVVLEVESRRSRRKRRIPLFAVEIDDGCPLVITGRGPWSGWVRDLRRRRSVRYWSRDGVQRARARLFGPPDGDAEIDDLPARCRRVAEALRPMTAFGWAYAFLVPIDASAASSGRRSR